MHNEFILKDLTAKSLIRLLHEREKFRFWNIPERWLADQVEKADSLHRSKRGLLKLTERLRYQRVKIYVDQS